MELRLKRGDDRTVIEAPVKDEELKLQLTARVFERAGEAIVITDAGGHIITVNAAFTAITGYTPDDAVGNTTALLKSGRHPPEFYRGLWRHLVEQGWWQGEIWNKRKNGEIYPEWLTINGIRDGDGRLTHYVALFSDISAIKNSQHRLEYLARHDDLTTLSNRAEFQNQLHRAIAQARREGRVLAVLFIDLDNFKTINDTLGHDVGDLLLKDVAQRILGCIRDADTVARLGGDEFAALLYHIDSVEVSAVCQRIVNALGQAFEIAQQTLFVTASVGISLFPNDGEDGGTLLKNADDGSVIGAEALIRWMDADIGSVSPAEFIPVAEKAGLIGRIGQFVVCRAIDDIVAWQRAGLTPPPVALNISPSQLHDDSFAAWLYDRLAAASLPASSIVVELTEGALMERGDVGQRVVEGIAQRGIKISIDDFGTGYSSLSYLKRMPIAELKIDRSFVDGIADEPDDQAIASAILSMAGALGLSVIAEGVETAQQVSVLQMLGCHAAQGYFFHRPMDAARFSLLLKARFATPDTAIRVPPSPSPFGPGRGTPSSLSLST